MKAERMELTGRNGRVAIVAGLRSPFARAGSQFRDLDAVQLGAAVVSELLARADLDPQVIDQCVFGQTIMKPEAPFIAREIVLATGMSPHTDAYSLTRACATSFQTVASAANSITVGEAEVVVAGGVDSTSAVRIPLSVKCSAILRDASFAKSPLERIRALSRLRPRDLIPSQPSITEYSTGRSMGESAEAMAKRWGITREEQDDIAHASHQKAANAWRDGKLRDEVMTVFVDENGKAVAVGEDNLVRRKSVRENYSKLKPVFDRQYGTVTAGNASALTDGAAALILMSESRAKALGYQPLAYLKSFAFAARSPKKDLLMGPVLAAPVALDRAGLTLQDMDLVDMHEAFAAQIACNVKGFKSRDYLEQHTGRRKALGEIDPERLNVLGGSLSYGHPFGATGARMITQTSNELRRRGGGLALMTACAAGGIGAAMVIEAE